MWRDLVWGLVGSKKWTQIIAVEAATIVEVKVVASGW
jgi:hypothetical protein